MLVDTHCHLDQFDDPAAVLREAGAHGVSRVVAMSQDIAATPTVVPSEAPQQVAPEALREKLAHDRVEAERRRSRRDSRKASLSREERESRWAERFMRAGGSEEKARERLDERSNRGSQRSSAERDARRAQRRQDMSPEDREARRARRAERRR